jgi:hypothetical protein
MLVPQLFFLLYQLVCFLVECQQIGVQLVTSLASATAVHHIIRFQGLFKVVPIVLLLTLVIWGAQALW